MQSDCGFSNLNEMKWFIVLNTGEKWIYIVSLS